jgi:hypothetical protein
VLPEALEFQRPGQYQDRQADEGYGQPEIPEKQGGQDDDQKNRNRYGLCAAQDSGVMDKGADNGTGECKYAKPCRQFDTGQRVVSTASVRFQFPSGLRPAGPCV